MSDVSTTYLLGSILALACGLYHLLRSRYPAFEAQPPMSPAEKESSSTFRLVEEDPSELRLRLLRRLDRIGFVVFVVAAGVLAALYINTRSNARSLPASQTLLFLAAILLAGAGGRYLMGVRYVHQIKTLVQQRILQSRQGPPGRSTPEQGTDTERVREELYGLLSGYLSAEELDYMHQQLCNQLHRTEKTSRASGED